MSTTLTYRDLRSNAEKISDEAIKERVLAGIELLTEKYGADWVEHITPKRLQLSDGASCVLGQVYGSYSTGLDYLFEGEDHEEDSRDQLAVEHGFLSLGSYRNLDAAWQTVFTGDDPDA